MFNQDFLVEFRPNKKDIEEILCWLKEEKEKHVYGYGFYNNKDIIWSSFEESKLITLKHQNKNVGFVTWHENDGIVLDIDIFTIHPQYRRRDIGERFFYEFENFCINSGFKAIKLFCEPITSEYFWRKVGFDDYPDCSYTMREKTLYKTIVETAPNFLTRHTDIFELWDVEPYESDNIAPRWAWYVTSVGDRLLQPIIQPCNCNWKLRWSRNGNVIKEEKVKYFTGKENENIKEIYKDNFLFIEYLY